MSISHTADTSDPENDIFLQVATPRPRHKSASQQIPSAEDTDSDYDDVYTSGIPQKNNKSVKSKKKKQKSQYAPLDQHKKQMKSYIIATVLCVAIIALLLVFMIDILFTDSNNSTSITNAPYNINTTTNLESPTYIPTYLPSSHPSLAPAIFPTTFPSQNPSINPSHSPSFIPTATPTYTPSQNPSTNPTKLPTQNPTVPPTPTPSIKPSTSPSHNPSRSPTTNPSVSPSIIPTQTPTNNPSLPPTQNPTISTGTPSVSPTPSPITMILQRGNDIYDQYITMNFPENSFPDSILTINIGQAAPTTQQTFDDTTTAFKAMSIHNVTNNALHFSVEHNPLDIANISYKTTIPIPADLLRQCPSHYGYEIFAQIQQNELIPTRTFPIFVLFESLYNPTAQSLTTWLFPEMFSNQNADIILSCTPGKNIVPVRRRNLLQNPNGKTLCKAAEIICPVESGCVVLNPFGRKHYGVDYALQSNPNIISAANGVVERSGSSAVYGNVIIIRNEDGSAAIYADLSENLVFLGDAVRQGQVIAIGGSMYFHFEYIANGEIYQTKKRINPNDCFAAAAWPTQSGGGDGTAFPTSRPTKSPLVAPNTHSPTMAPTLVTGSITVRDSGQYPDDAFAVYIDGFKVCETEVGHPNTCAISFLRPGLHTLTLEVIIAPDTFGTFYVALSNGWKFTDGTNSTTFEDDTTKLFPVGWRGSWNFTVPFPDVPVPP